MSSPVYRAIIEPPLSPRPNRPVCIYECVDEMYTATEVERPLRRSGATKLPEMAVFVGLSNTAAELAFQTSSKSTGRSAHQRHPCVPELPLRMYPCIHQATVPLLAALMECVDCRRFQPLFWALHCGGRLRSRFWYWVLGSGFRGAGKRRFGGRALA